MSKTTLRHLIKGNSKKGPSLSIGIGLTDKGTVTVEPIRISFPCVFGRIVGSLK